jgi:hypothetical protein
VGFAWGLLSQLRPPTARRSMVRADEGPLL